MFTPLLALTLAQFFAEPSQTGTIDGQCLYPEAVLARAGNDMQVTCNQAEIADDSITFSARGWGPRMTFAGTFENDRLTVSGVMLRDGRLRDARGVCQLYYANERLSTVACTAIANHQSYAANFVVSRI